jgi:hypothetical protein
MGRVERSGSRVALALLSLSSTVGCSWIFVQPLPPEHGYDYQPCTSSRVAPVIDTILTITNIASALYVGTRDNVTNKGESVTLGIGAATMWALSAGYGYSHTAECEEAHELDEHGYHAPPYLRAPPRYYPQPPPQVGAPPGSAGSWAPSADPAAVPAAPPPADPSAAPAVPRQAPAAGPPPAPAAPQQQDDDDPNSARARAPQHPDPHRSGN